MIKMVGLRVFEPFWKALTRSNGWFVSFKARFIDFKKNNCYLYSVPKLAFLSLALIACHGGHTASGHNKGQPQSQVQQRILKDPQELKIQPGPQYGGDVNVTLEIKYADNQIFNPGKKRYDKVHLRPYNGALVGPTIRVMPSDTLHVNLINNLPVDRLLPYCLCFTYSQEGFEMTSNA